MASTTIKARSANAARNAMLPNLSGFAMSLGFVIAGSILVEYVFNYPGLGYMLYNAVGMPWPNQGLIGAAALVIAGLYALTPIKRASEAFCRERCALHGPLPFNLMRCTPFSP